MRSRSILPEEAKDQLAASKCKITSTCQHFTLKQTPAPAPHWAQLVCADCGRWVRFISDPARLELNKRNRMRIQKLLGIAVKLTPGELEFLAASSKSRNGSFGTKRQAILDDIFARYFGTDKEEQQ
jgi:hypothetical protein